MVNKIAKNPYLDKKKRIYEIIEIIQKIFKKHDILFHYRFNFQDYTIDFEHGTKLNECFYELAEKIIDFLK